MASKGAKAVDAALGDLPIDDRVAALVCSFVMRKTQSLVAVASLSSLISLISIHVEMTSAERIILAEGLRDVADAVEHKQERVKA
jgi:hypothetical protein